MDASFIDGYPTYTYFYDTRPYATERNNYSTPIGNDLIRSLVLKAKLRGQDPNEVLAQAGAESTWGNWDDPRNPLHLFVPRHLSIDQRIANVIGEDVMNASPSKEVAGPVRPKDLTDMALNYKWYLENVRYPKDRDKALQAYQGLGTLTRGIDNWSGKTQKAGKTRPYVARVRALQKALIDNVPVQMIVQRTLQDAK